MNIYSNIATKVLGVADSALGNQGAVVSASIPLVVAGLTIWIAWFGWNTARGATGSYIVSDLIATISRVFLVLTIALAGGAYGSNVASAIKGAPAEFASFMGVTVVSDLYATLDMQQGKVVETVGTIYNLALGLPFSSLGLTIGMLLFSALLGFLLTVYLFLAACIMLGMDTALKVILLFGPWFIAALAFPKTESFFYPWFNTAVATAMGIAALLLPLSITMGLFQGWIADLAIKGNPSEFDLVGATLTAFAAVGLSYYLLIKMPQLIGGMIGSSVGGAGGIAQSMKNAVSSVLGTASNAAQAAAGHALSKASPSKAAAAGNALQAMSSSALPSNPFIRALQRGGGNMPSAGMLTGTPNAASTAASAAAKTAPQAPRAGAASVPNWTTSGKN
jgi:hypothetical protein